MMFKQQYNYQPLSLGGGSSVFGTCEFMKLDDDVQPMRESLKKWWNNYLILLKLIISDTKNALLKVVRTLKWWTLKCEKSV